MYDRVEEVLVDQIGLVALFKVGDLLRDPLQDLADVLDADGGDLLLVEVDVLVEELDVELDLGAGVHALGGDLEALFQAVVDALFVTELERKKKNFVDTDIFRIGGQRVV